MAFIVVELAGKKTFGGYLQIDGGKQILLSDAQIIFVEDGTHYLSFSDTSTTVRTMNNLYGRFSSWAGSSVGLAVAVHNEVNAIDGEVTVELYENSIIFFTVVSDAARHILGQPTYVIERANEEKMKKIVALYNEQVEATEQSEAEVKKNKEDDSKVIEFVLCLLLGGMGIHKFYRKKIGMGILYMFTLGLFGIGWLFDTIRLLQKLVSK